MPANVETMAYRYANRNDVPWHGLGTQVDRNEEVSTVEFQQRAGANWPVFKRELYFKQTRGDTISHIKVPRAYALVRGDTLDALNVVGEQYKPVQNVEVFDFYEQYCKSGDMIMETAGVLDHGRIVWALATLKEGFTLVNDDRVTGHLLFSNSHGGDALRIMFTPIRVVCANTLALAHSASGGFRLNHRRKFDPDVARKHLGLATEQMEEFHEQADILAMTPMNSAGFARFLEKLFPETKDKDGNPHIPYARGHALQAFGSQPDVNLNATWWRGYNAITYMVDHMRKPDDAEGRLRSAWFGAGAELKRKALTTALEMAHG